MLLSLWAHLPAAHSHWNALTLSLLGISIKYISLFPIYWIWGIHVLIQYHILFKFKIAFVLQQRCPRLLYKQGNVYQELYRSTRLSCNLVISNSPGTTGVTVNFDVFLCMTLSSGTFGSIRAMHPSSGDADAVIARTELNIGEDYPMMSKENGPTTGKKDDN